MDQIVRTTDSTRAHIGAVRCGLQESMLWN